MDAKKRLLSSVILSGSEGSFTTLVSIAHVLRSFAAAQDDIK